MHTVEDGSITESCLQTSGNTYFQQNINLTWFQFNYIHQLQVDCILINTFLSHGYVHISLSHALLDPGTDRVLCCYDEADPLSYKKLYL